MGHCRPAKRKSATIDQSEHRHPVLAKPSPDLTGDAFMPAHPSRRAQRGNRGGLGHGHRSSRCSLDRSYAGVDDGQGDIRQQVADDDEERGNQHRHEHRVVPIPSGIEEEAPHTCPTEDALGDQGAAEDRRELDAGQMIGRIALRRMWCRSTTPFASPLA